MLNNSVDIDACNVMCDAFGSERFWQLFVRYVEQLFVFIIHTLYCYITILLILYHCAVTLNTTRMVHFLLFFLSFVKKRILSAHPDISHTFFSFP